MTQTPEVAWRAIAPALALAGGGVIALLVIAARPKIHRAALAALSLAAIGAASWSTFDLCALRYRVVMQGSVAVDGVSLFANLILLVTAAMTVLLSYHYLERRRIHRAEYYPLLLFATCGMVLLAAANDLILVFLAIEVLSLALYVLAGMARRDAGSQEAALKYLLLGAFSTAIFLYGIALSFGATGTTNLGRTAVKVASGGVDARLTSAAMALLAIGFGFKVSVVPFHMWTPDVYQGAPTSVTGFMAAGTKAAGFAALLRVFLVSFGALQWSWRPVLWGLAAATMVVGSILAIAQSDVKRMLAYSSIAHAGFVLVGVVAGGREGLSASLFYLLAYAVMVLGAFGAVIVSAPDGRERLSFGEWAGLGQRHPVFAGAMTLFLLSLAGIPPTAGFMGKFFVFSAAVQAGETPLVVVGVLASVVAAFFYLRLIVLMWLTEPAGEAQELGASPAPALALALAAAATLAFGVYPQAIMDLARAASVFTG
ncbi:MAG: NADH-quinone oxidoreductase subunit NuoN [Acidobacteria bacterium]|nr:NADH-quinone oxidoreductase subunit NuoN [Acidobacteriota bacterium]